MTEILLRQVYVASALMEFRFDKGDTKVPRNIFELGLSNYLGEPAYVLEYVNFLLALGDLPNVRALLERALAVTPPSNAQPLYDRYIQVSLLAMWRTPPMRNPCMTAPSS